jgi:PhzF family phenazine biosynthesis protein
VFQHIKKKKSDKVYKSHLRQVFSKNMQIKTFIIDAFTNEPFKGNPAGVCLSEQEIEADLMQSIAAELNLSETAFLQQDKADKNKFSIRYFTPTVEIPFCGHATLASSKLVLHRLGLEEAEFNTYFGLNLAATSHEDSIVMKFPLYGTTDFTPSSELYEAFGINNPVAARFSKDLEMLIIEVADKHTLEKINPDYVKAVKAPDAIKELVITTKSPDHNYDFYSRCFCPWIGINEDPVTGASHSVLAKYWGDILDRTEMSAYQASKRGGYMNLKIISDHELQVTSNAQIVFEGALTV